MSGDVNALTQQLEALKAQQAQLAQPAGAPQLAAVPPPQPAAPQPAAPPQLILPPAAAAPQPTAAPQPLPPGDHVTATTQQTVAVNPPTSSIGDALKALREACAAVGMSCEVTLR